MVKKSDANPTAETSGRSFGKQNSEISGQNQHYVSQVLLRRFTDKGYLQRFDVKWNKWKRKSPEGVFSKLGYTQLLAYGGTDNSLEESFKKIEDIFPVTLNALNNLAVGSSTTLPANIYENLFWYCAYLWRISPFAKAKAPIDFVIQLNMDLANGKIELLQALGIQEDDIKTIQKLHADGAKFIFRGDDYLQIVYRIQFARKCWEDYWLFRHYAKWTLYKSPIELPISDIALVQYFDESINATVYLLPVSPHLLLKGIIKTGTQHKSDETVINRGVLSTEEAEYFLDVICLTALTALASKSRIHDISAIRKRATERKIRFAKIKNLESVLSAGMKPFDGPLMIFPVSNTDYLNFIKSFIGNE